MKITRLCSLILLLIGMPIWTSDALAQEPVDQEAVDLIREQGLENSQVMNYLGWMTDVYGPRLTGSPMLDKASTWAMEEMERMGLTNIHKEAWGPFGKGWTLEELAVEAATPYGSFPLTAYPKAWSPGTEGKVTGEVVLVEAESADDLEKYEGTLSGKIVLTQGMREVEEPFEPIATRRDDSNLLRLATSVPSPGGNGRRFGGGGGFSQRQVVDFIISEKPLAMLDRGTKGDYGTIFVSGATVPATEDNIRVQALDAPETVPQLTVAVEHYNRLVRLIEKDIPVTVALDLQVAFDTSDPMEYNVIGELAGADPSLGKEVVMLGAHYDSWHAGTGATDNASGSAVMMEAMRILNAVYSAKGEGPRRTLRIGLWTGEEQGLLGSRAYVAEHFAESPGRGEPPTELKPAHASFSAYYNLDNGTGKIRGVYLQGNDTVEPIFRAWLAPFHDLDAATLSLNNTGGTDHLSFDAVGLPGFQFIQEPIAYSPKTHHSNMDVYDHAIEEDLMQAATIIAAFAYHTAERDEKLPRKPLPETSSE